MRGKSKAIINSRETKFVQDKMYKHDLVGKKKNVYSQFNRNPEQSFHENSDIITLKELRE